MAEIEAHLTSSVATARTGGFPLRRAATGRTALRAGAVVLALVGIGALLVRPSSDTRAVARVTAPRPLVVGDVVAAILAHSDGATATASGRTITVVASDANRTVARDRVLALARTGLDGARQRLVGLETGKAQAAGRDGAQATAQLASLTARTHLTDPAAEYRAQVALVTNLKAQLAAATASGQPVGELEAQLAERQQGVFELQLLVTRYSELTQAEATAGAHERAATDAIAAGTHAASSAAVDVSDHSPSGGFAIVAGVAALVVAAAVLLLSQLRRRRGAPRALESRSLESRSLEPAVRQPALEIAEREAAEITEPPVAEPEPAVVEPAVVEVPVVEPAVAEAPVVEVPVVEAPVVEPAVAEVPVAVVPVAVAPIPEPTVAEVTAVAEPEPAVAEVQVPEPTPAVAEVPVMETPVVEPLFVEPAPRVMEPAPRPGSRFLEFFNALAPTPAEARDPLPPTVDLVREEAAEAATEAADDVEPQPVREADSTRP